MIRDGLRSPVSLEACSERLQTIPYHAGPSHTILDHPGPSWSIPLKQICANGCYTMIQDGLRSPGGLQTWSLPMAPLNPGGPYSLQRYSRLRYLTPSKTRVHIPPLAQDGTHRVFYHRARTTPSCASGGWDTRPIRWQKHYPSARPHTVTVAWPRFAGPPWLATSSTARSCH